MKRIKFFRVLFIVLIFIGFHRPLRSETIEKAHDPFSLKDTEENMSFENSLLKLSKKFITHNDKISNKEEIIDLLSHLNTSSCYVQVGNDDIRSKFVHSQGAIEYILACLLYTKEITHLVGIIHTPTIATPLCVLPDKTITKGILDDSTSWDKDKLLTIQSRATIVRSYLFQGGKLYIAYPKEGIKKRSEKQQEIYKNELALHKKNLINATLKCKEMDPNMIGATYLFKTSNNEILAFSIKARQANDAQSNSEWGLWLGSYDSPKIRERVDQIFKYIKANGGPTLKNELKEMLK